MEKNNCTNNQNVTPKATTTEFAIGAKTLQEILNMASDMVPGATGQTFLKMVDSLKDLDANVAVYIAEMQNRGFNTRTAIEALTRIEAEENAAKARAAEEEKAAKAWMSIGEGKVWRPIYAYCSAIISSAYTNPIRDMATAIMGALTASSDKVHTTTVLSLKLTQAYAQADKNSSFIRMINNINDYMTSIYDEIKSGSTEDGYYKLEDTKYAVTTWIETVLNPDQNN